MNVEDVTESSVVRKPGVRPAKTSAALIDDWRSVTRSVGVWLPLVVDVESETAASAYSVILLFTAKDQPPLVGSYRDRFVLTGEGWRFSERRGALTFPSA